MLGELKNWLKHLIKNKQFKFSVIMLIIAFYFATRGLVNFSRSNGLKLSFLTFSFMKNDMRIHVFMLLSFVFGFSGAYSSFDFGKRSGAKMFFFKLFVCALTTFLYVLILFILAQVCTISVSSFDISSFAGWGKLFSSSAHRMNFVFLPNSMLLENYKPEFIFIHSLVSEFCLLFLISLIFIVSIDILKRLFSLILIIGIIFSDILFYNLYFVSYRKFSIVAFSMLSSFEEMEKGCGLTFENSIKAFFVLTPVLLIMHFLNCIIMRKKIN